MLNEWTQKKNNHRLATERNNNTKKSKTLFISGIECQQFYSNLVLSLSSFCSHSLMVLISGNAIAWQAHSNISLKLISDKSIQTNFSISVFHRDTPSKFKTLNSIQQMYSIRCSLRALYLSALGAHRKQKPKRSIIIVYVFPFRKKKYKLLWCIKINECLMNWYFNHDHDRQMPFTRCVRAEALDLPILFIKNRREKCDNNNFDGSINAINEWMRRRITSCSQHETNTKKTFHTTKLFNKIERAVGERNWKL